MSNASPRRILIVVAFLHGATHLYTTFLQPLNSELKEYFGLTLDKQVTLIPAVYFICYAASNLLSGFLVTRVAPRTLLAIGPIVNGLCIAAMYFLKPEHYLGMLGLTALGALGGGLYHPVGNLLLTEAFPLERGRVLGISGIGACVAFIVAPLLSSNLVHRGFCSWQMVCVLYGCAGVAAGICALMLLPRGHTRDVFAVGTETTASRNSETRAVLLFAGLMVLVTAGREIASWGTTAITQQFTLATYKEPVDAGLLLALIFVPGMIVQPLAGRWSDIVGRERVLCGALACAALSLIILPLVPRDWIYVPYLMFGSAMMASVPTSDALVADRAPPRLRGLAFGIVITAAFGTGSLGPLITGFVADSGHRTAEAYRWGFWTLAGIVTFSFMVALMAKSFATRLGVVRFGRSDEQVLEAK